MRYLIDQYEINIFESKINTVWCVVWDRTMNSKCVIDRPTKFLNTSSVIYLNKINKIMSSICNPYPRSIALTNIKNGANEREQ